jgi:plastocyanin
MFRSLILVTLALSACVARPRPAPVASAPATGPVSDTVTVHLSNFAFTPESIRLQARRPVMLTLINDSDGGHDFSAPALFAASTFPTGTAPPKDGAQEVDQHSRVELRFTPQKPGHYEVTCTHFLHELFGMVGTVEVLPAG